MMITRTLLAALCCTYAVALSPHAPLQQVGDAGDCALYLNGPGRTSAYDYSINLLKGNFGYEGQANCITYEAINQAYLEARNRILVSQPKGDWKAEDFASVGELILDISISLARRYGLTYEEIEKGLPLIDTSRTLIREVCPPVFSHVECRAGKYRRFDGLCNNLQHPTWGATMAPFQRLIGPLFADGINAPRIAHHGKDLPLSRVVSRTMHPDEGFHDHAGTVMVIAWGQFMDHDYTLTATPLDPVNRNDPEECCKRPPHLKHPYCNEIRIPDDDYFYRLFGVKCIDFVRGFPSPRPGCRLGSRTPFNTLTGVIDGNTVYGVTEKFSRKLRTGFGGLLRMNPVFKEYGLKDLLPLKLDIPDEGCTRPNKNMYCFEAGEIRVNEQLVLTVMHTLMAREHNRVANALAEVNPHWDDETLFQEARRINIAEIQHITYNEFLPILLGKDVMEKFGLVLEKEGYWDGYDPAVNPDVIASFAAAAYRFGHSLLPTAVERWSKAHKFIASKRLSDLIRRPYDLYRAGVLDEYVMGLMNQVAQAMDDSITQEVTNHLFKKIGARFGMDLVSFNMQRGREFGLPGYMEFRKFCGLPPAETFQDLFGSMPNATVQKYETIFDHPIDVDLWSGGVSERPLPGSMLGPTFACVIATQFSYSRRGDRFWFELPNQPSSFTPEQLVEIRKARMARVICDNTDIIDTVQLYPMVLPDHELNPRVPCRSGVIPSMDFSKWAEPAPFRGSAKQFMTNATTADNNSMNYEQIKGDNCNQTAGTDKETQNCGGNKLHIQKNQCYTTGNNNSTIDCEIPSKNENNSTKNNLIMDQNTVLKYVYKKGDMDKIPIKNKGHFKNSLKRRKRSTNELENNSPLPSKFQKPVVVNYETSHGPVEVPLLPVRGTGHAILKANLADFSIETNHNNFNLKNSDSLVSHLKKESTEDPNRKEAWDVGNKGENKSNQNDINRKPNDESEESSERGANNNENLNRGDRDSTEREDYKIRDDSAENDYTQRPQSDSRKGVDSGEHNTHENSNHSNQKGDDGERENLTDNNSSYQRDYSSERKDTKNGFTGTYDSVESAEETPRIKTRYSSSPDNSKYNTESNENEKYHRNSAESKDSVETDESDKKLKSQNIKNNDEPNHNDSSNEQKQNEKKPINNFKSSSESSEEVNEGSENTSKPQEKQQYQNAPPLNYNNKGFPVPNQHTEQGDYSYERIHVNNHGKVEPLKENLQNEDLSAAVEILPLTTVLPNLKNKDFDTQQSLSTKSNKLRNNKLIHIDDDEVKPVIEINTETDSRSSEESKASISDESESLESILGVNEQEKIDDNRQSDKIITEKDIQKGDVKQQFERIPLNYNHNENNPKEKSTIIKTPNEENSAVIKSDGTLDVFAPKNIRYDENLNIKFDDLAFELPEIKLPDDILAYTTDNSPYNDEKKKQSEETSYRPRYNKDDDDDSQENRNKKDDDGSDENDDQDDTEYYSHYGDRHKNQNYNKDAEAKSDEEEDLYEKFVRERFGKQGTFEKRSEKLIKAPTDPELYKTIKNILKKTADIDEQAKKSGDPNAGYMWTLEYGEKL